MGPDAEPAAAFVRATAAHLVATASADPECVDDPSLANGALGKALLCHQAATTGLAPEAADAAEAYVNQCLAAVRMRPGSLGLYSGSAGLLWFLARWLADVPRQLHRVTGVEQTAELLARWLGSEQARATPYDLISGVAGLAVAGAAVARAGQTPVLAAAATKWLVEAQATDAPGTWRTSADHAPHVGNPSGAPIFNLGVAHGVPGALGAIAAAVETGIRNDAATDALQQGLDRLLTMAASQPLGEPVYPYWLIGDRAFGGRSRAAWCYGDPGVAAVLHRCAARLGPAALGHTAVLRRVAATGLQRLPYDAEVTDPGLCHGAAGLAHIANRLFQDSGDDVFRQSAIRWGRVALDLVASWDPAPTPGRSREPLPAGYLTGAAGVALVFTAMVTSEPPWWDETLLL